jgi:transcriptional regulator with XRE-family HTH domain
MAGSEPKQEFRELLKASGWSQAEAARQLAMTPSALSQIVRENSPVRPSPVTLRLFALLLRWKKPEAPRRTMRQRVARRGEQWEDDLIRALRRVPSNTRGPILNVVHTLIDAARSKAAGRKKCRRIRSRRGGIG